MGIKHLILSAIAFFIFWLAVNFLWVEFVPFTSHGKFFLASNLLFFVLILFTFTLGHLSIKTKNNSLFLFSFLGSIFLKFMAGLMIFIVYFFLFEPQDWWYLIPFFMVFVSYKVLEIYGMTVLNKKMPEGLK